MKTKVMLTLFVTAMLGMSMFMGGCDRSPMQVREIPLEDFFKNPEKSRYRISPDGKYYSYMAPYESRMNIFVQEIGTDSATRLTSETDRGIAGYFWKNPDPTSLPERYRW